MNLGLIIVFVVFMLNRYVFFSMFGLIVLRASVIAVPPKCFTRQLYDQLCIWEIN